MLYHNMVRILRCPKCQRAYDGWLLSLSTRLGPGLKQCRKCEEVFNSGRLEWPEQDKKTRALTLAISSLYLIVSCEFTGILFYNWDHDEPRVPFSEAPIEVSWVYQASGILLMAMILFFKFLNSMRRFERHPDLPTRDESHSLSLIFGTQIKVAMFWFLLSLFSS